MPSVRETLAGYTDAELSALYVETEKFDAQTLKNNSKLRKLCLTQFANDGVLELLNASAEVWREIARRSPIR